MNLRTLSVTELNQYIKRIINSDPILNAIKVEGEISNFKKHSSGHAYFSIKDDNSRINCVMFSNYFESVDFTPKDGQMVEIFGRVSVYEKNGTYQLYVNQMKSAGIGYLYKKYAELKKKLENEGLFDVLCKKNIQKYPKKIAIITSKTGAAIHDVISVVRRRNPLVDILILPSSVQGGNTIDEVVKAFENLKNRDDIDTVILTRGGGSYDELFNFNDEVIARKIHECRIPVISAIGHEVDFTIADFVADLRAPTPSAAGELVTEDIFTIIENQKKLLNNMEYVIGGNIKKYEKLFGKYHYDYLQFPIIKQLTDNVHNLDNIMNDITHFVNKQLVDVEHRYQLIMEKINSNNPL
ncbi:MAG: exodeoxyribonuclease VII large subunit, partial [Bacillota bacterium]|nr:exodeoxyribonuclease VII large subunit [Bacillota bacterium]